MKDKIRNFVAKGDIKEALGVLLKMYKNENPKAYDKLIIIQSNYLQLSKQKTINIISDDFYQREVNRINNEILNFDPNTEIDIIENGEPEKSMVGLIVISIVFVAIIAIIFNFQMGKNNDDFKKLASFMELDKKEAIDEFEKVRNQIIDLSEKDELIKEIVEENELIKKLNSYEADFQRLQSENIPAVEKGDFLYSREIRKKINSLPEKYDLDNISLNSIEWNFGDLDIVNFDSSKIIKFENYLDESIHAITLKVGDSCGDTTSKMITVFPNSLESLK